MANAFLVMTLITTVYAIMGVIFFSPAAQFDKFSTSLFTVSAATLRLARDAERVRGNGNGGRTSRRFGLARADG